MTLKAASTALFLLLACAQLSGCTQWHFVLGTPLANITQPESGAAVTRHDALQLLGPPMHMSATADGYVMAWEFWHITENSIGLTFAVLGADFINLDWGKLDARGEYLLLGFNAAHEVSSLSRGEWDDKAGGGVALQPLATFLSVVDSNDLRESMAEHDWGADLLLPMPTGLNRQSSSDTGQNGLQQRGTPRVVGQQSLEMD